jgi:hypothetical protein
MKRYAIRYVRMPTNYHDVFVAVAEAETPALALELLQHRLGDHSGVRNYNYSEPEEYREPASRGRVISLNEGESE